MAEFTISRKSPLSGKEQTMTLPISADEYYRCQALRNRGALIQEAFPMLSDEQREFILTGITPEEWNDAFAEAEEEDPDHGDGRGDFEAF